MARSWSLIAVAKQAIVLYGILEKDAAKIDDEQSRQFWRSHRHTAEDAIRAHRRRKR